MRVEELLNPAPPRKDRSPGGKGGEWASTVTYIPDTTAADTRTPSPLARTPSDFNTASPDAIRNPARASRPRKDEPIFERKTTRGKVAFPPHEPGTNEEIKLRHREFRIFPAENIRQYCHRIPYNSSKRTLLEKAGRNAMEVFQYTFTMPGQSHGKPWVVMWDYNIGLVKTTSFFRALGYSKTMPSKVQKMNDGLKDIMHNVTGGALIGQGYWMPYEVARALASTFCYPIRYALTPIFGNDFVNQCLHPSNPMFDKFRIDPALISACVRVQQGWLEGAIASQPLTPVTTPDPSLAGISPSKSTFEIPLPASLPHVERLRPKTQSRRIDRRIFDTDTESGYSTETDYSALDSPQISPKTKIPVTPAPPVTTESTEVPQSNIPVWSRSGRDRGDLEAAQILSLIRTSPVKATAEETSPDSRSEAKVQNKVLGEGMTRIEHGTKRWSPTVWPESVAKKRKVETHKETSAGNLGSWESF